MCNLYSITTNQEAIARLFRKVNRYVGKTRQAIYPNRERVFNPDRKDHHWGKRKLKRDR